MLGFAVRRWERVREAGPVFVGLGALLTPFTFLILYVRVLDEQDVPVAWTWLAGSTTTSRLYFLLVRTGYGRLYAVPGTVAALMAWGSLGAPVEIGEEWYGAWFAALAPVANGLGAYRFKSTGSGRNWQRSCWSCRRSSSHRARPSSRTWTDGISPSPTRFSLRR